jgi:hypothetical protein
MRDENYKNGLKTINKREKELIKQALEKARKKGVLK